MTTIKTRLLITAIGCGSLLMAGCASQPGQSSTQLTASSTLAQGEHLLVLDQQHWLAIGPDHPLQLGHSGEQSADVWQGEWAGEFLDARMQGNKVQAVTVDEQNRLHLLTLKPTPKGYQLAQDAAGEPIAAALEGLCLYAPEGDALQVFLLDENAMGHQLMLNPASSASNTKLATKLNTTLLRSFATAPGAKYCVSDDQRDTLYISEQAVGVWKMNARAESDPVRTMVEMAQPFGHIEGEAGPLAVQGNSLWLAEGESSRLHQYRLDNNQYQGLDLVQSTAGATETDTLLISPLNGTATLFDKASESLLQVRLPSQPAVDASDRIPTLAAMAETTPVQTAGDAADDPAIWVNKKHPEKSLVLGTNKKYSLDVYDLNGKLQQQLPVGRVNNVDVRQQFTLHGKPMDIATASHRDHSAISLFAIDPVTGKVSEAGIVKTTLESVYGLCMYKNKTGEIFTFINSENGKFEQYQIVDGQQGWTGKLVRKFAVESQPEGCAADDRAQRLFLGEENRAVWTLGAEPSDSVNMTEVANFGDKLVADIEGMDIYQTATENYLVVSSQGNDSYVMFEADAPYSYVGRFRIGLNAAKGIDGASETDGLTVTSVNLGSDYPEGMLVVQDGRNLMPDEGQNFKFVDWRSVRSLLAPGTL